MAKKPKTSDAARMAREHTHTAISTLAEICAFGESERGRVSAATALLDRGHGRAAQTLDVTSGGRAIVPIGLGAFYAKVMEDSVPQAIEDSGGCIELDPLGVRETKAEAEAHPLLE